MKKRKKKKKKKKKKMIREKKRKRRRKMRIQMIFRRIARKRLESKVRWYHCCQRLFNIICSEISSSVYTGYN